MKSLLLIASLALASNSFAAPIRLAAAEFDPMLATPRIREDLTTPLNLRDPLLIVQFDSVVGESQKLALAGVGANVLDYFPENAFLVRGDATALREVEGVRWVGAFHPFYRIDPALGQRGFVTDERLTEVLQGVMRMSVTLTRDADPVLTQILIQNLGGQVLASGRIGDQPILVVRGPKSLSENIARLESVQFIEDSSEITSRNSSTRWVVQTNAADTTPFYTVGLTGLNQIIGVLDGRIRVDHTSFVSANPIGPTHRKIVYYGSTTGSDSHGTHVAGTAAGDAGVFDDRRGIAFEAKLAFTVTPSFTETAMYTVLQTHHNQGARVHTNSWGDDGTTSYNGLARAVDRFSWDFEESVVLFAITNITNVLRNPENAKSSLSVGATGNVPNQNSRASTFSGTGPTADLRRKPEVTAPGESIPSSSSSNVNGTLNLSGTSMATPAVAGSTALVRQALQEGRFWDGNANASLGMTPSGALMRAVIIASGSDMTGVVGYPSNTEGYGRVELDNVLPTVGGTRRTMVWEARNSAGLQTGQSRTFRVLVTDTSVPLRFVMAFTDFPAAAATATGAAAINNLNLSVTNPSNQVFNGNVFNASGSGVSVTGGTADAINSAEMVNLPTPAAGLYTITIAAPAVPQGTRQGFGLVATGGIVTSRITGVLNFEDWVGAIPTSLPVTFVNASGTAYPGGAVTMSVNPTTRAFTVNAPPTVNGAFRIRIDHAAFLRRSVPLPAQPASTDLFANFATVTLVNGDVNRSGEVDLTDIDFVISRYLQANVGPLGGDVDGSGEVDLTDIDVVISNYLQSSDW